MGSSYCDRSCILRPPGRYATEGTTWGRVPRPFIVVEVGRAAQFCLLIPTHMCSQNLVLPDTFFSFYDLRREFHVQHPSARLARDLTVATMAQGTCDPEGLEWRGIDKLYVSEYVHAGGLYEHIQLALSAESLSARLCVCAGAHMEREHISTNVWTGGSVRAYMSRVKTNVLAGILHLFM